MSGDSSEGIDPAGWLPVEMVAELGELLAVAEAVEPVGVGPPWRRAITGWAVGITRGRPIPSSPARWIRGCWWPRATIGCGHC